MQSFVYTAASAIITQFVEMIKENNVNQYRKWFQFHSKLKTICGKLVIHNVYVMSECFLFFFFLFLSNKDLNL